MATLTIRNVDAAVKEKLRVRAARHGRSMEAEFRAIVAEAIGSNPQAELELAEAIRRRFASFGGVELERPPRLQDREPPAGVAVLPNGRRRVALEAAARAMFDDEFDLRVPPFDGAAALAYAEILAARRRAGTPVAPLDLMIAAVALARSASMVTRGTGGFADCGLILINPWEAA